MPDLFRISAQPRDPNYEGGEVWAKGGHPLMADNAFLTKLDFRFLKPIIAQLFLTLCCYWCNKSKNVTSTGTLVSDIKVWPPSFLFMSKAVIMFS